MSPGRLAEIRAWHVANQRAAGRTELRCAAGCDGCMICHVADLLREVDRLAEWLDVAAAAENANARELSELRDLIALHGPVGAGNEADTLVEMKRFAFLDGLEAAAKLCEFYASPRAVPGFADEDERDLCEAGSALRRIDDRRKARKA